MGEFIRRLGKLVQRLWNKIFGKKKQYDPLGVEANGLWKNHVSDGIFFIDGEPIGEVKAISSLTPEEHDKALAEIEDIIANTDWNKVAKNLELEFTMDNWNQKELENLVNTSCPILPKHYSCKTLIVTIAANQPYEYQSMDISQLEERGIAHFVIGRTIGFQEIGQEYRRMSKLDSEEEIAERVEWLREGAETGLCSMIYGNADLYYYEELGYWDFD